MARKWKKKNPEFKKQAVERMEEAKDIGLLAQELGSRGARYIGGRTTNWDG